MPRQRLHFLTAEAEQDFAEHRENWIGCKACPLCKTRSKVVLFRGTLPCDILFVGEAPGESEDALGFPFVGPAGHLFDELVNSALMAPYTDCPPECRLCGRSVTSNYCHACGCPFALQKTGITNIVSCIPKQEVMNPDESMGSLEIRPPTKDEATACRPRLMEIYQLAKPKRVVCLGNVAERFFYKLPREFPPAEVRTLLHPAAILRTNNPSGQSLQEKRWVLQLAKIMKELQV